MKIFRFRDQEDELRLVKKSAVSQLKQFKAVPLRIFYRVVLPTLGKDFNVHQNAIGVASTGLLCFCR